MGKKRKLDLKASESHAADAPEEICSSTCKTKTKSNESPKETFGSLGMADELCGVIENLGWRAPTSIQRKVLPPALSGRDIIGLAETGSGKTGAFGLPMLQHLVKHPEPFCGLIVTPTRELALQIRDQLTALGAGFQARCACIVGGADFAEQTLELDHSEPHLIVGTPGRLVDHVEHSERFKLALTRIKFCVLDEADRLLHSEFEIPIQRILACLPKERQTMLFSATMTKKVGKLQRAALIDPLRISVSAKGATVSGLDQRFVLVPRLKKDCAMFHLVRERLAVGSCVLFTDTCEEAQRLALMLRYLGLAALPLHGRMSQQRRKAALAIFRRAASDESHCLVATDVASRGLDIASVDTVFNYSVPGSKKDYVHRVGRTARAGREGQAVTLVTQYDVGAFQMLEKALDTKMKALEVASRPLEELLDRVQRAEIAVRKVMAEEANDGRKRRRRDLFDE